MEQAAKVERLNKQRASDISQMMQVDSDNISYESDIAEHKARITELEAALVTYARHQVLCSQSVSGTNCDCGLDELKQSLKHNSSTKPQKDIEVLKRAICEKCRNVEWCSEECSDYKALMQALKGKEVRYE